MKRIFVLIALAVSVLSFDAQARKNDDLDLRIGSYNVWSHLARKGQIDKKNAVPSRGWDVSKQAVAELIVKMDCDIIGMQEVTSVCRDDLKELVRKAGGKYELWWKNTYPEGHRSVVGNAVFFRKGAFKFEDKNIYYFSPTPEVMSQGWDEKRYYRAALTATVTHKKTGKKFFFIATHGPLGDEANGHAGRILVEIDKKYNTEGLPAIVVGDMNANPSEPFYSTMCSHYEDTYNTAESKCGNVGTFNGAVESEDSFKLSNRRIDHIYVHSTDKGTFKVKKYEVNRDKYEVEGNMHYPSDHNPVIVDMVLK